MLRALDTGPPAPSVTPPGLPLCPSTPHPASSAGSSSNSGAGARGRPAPWRLALHSSTVSQTKAPIQNLATPPSLTPFHPFTIRPGNPGNPYPLFCFVPSEDVFEILRRSGEGGWLGAVCVFAALLVFSPLSLMPVGPRLLRDLGSRHPHGIQGLPVPSE